MARILIAERREVFRLGLRACLPPSSQLVAEASHGPEAVKKAAQMKPDLVIVADDISGLNILNVIQRIRLANPSIGFLVLVDETTAELLRRLITADVGYLRRDASASMIATVIEDLRTTPYERKGTAEEHSPAADKLSPQQLRVARLVADGFRTREIARLLRMSERTVSAHRAEIVKRLGLRSSAGIGRHL